MTIDPLAASMTAPSAVKEPVPSGDVAGTASPTQAELFGYLAEHGTSLHNINALTAAGQAEQLANPTTLGDRILASMHGFPQRAQQMKDMVHGLASPASAPAPAPAQVSGAATPNLPRGPAAEPVAASSKNAPDGVPRLMGLVEQSFDFAIETTLISHGLGQGASAINTLVKGQ